MHVLSIHNNAELHKNGSHDKGHRSVVDDLIREKKHVFVLIYMDGCGPCNATRPEWGKMAHTLKKQYFNRDDVVILDVNKNLLPSIKSLGSINEFPTMKYITNQGKTQENYEDSAVKIKDRSVDSFINWIESKIMKGKIVSVKPVSAPEHVYKRITKKHGKRGSKNHRTKYNKSRKNKGKSRRRRR